MKAILISIRPEWVAKILNKEKTIEIRKRFPSDYVGWVYIYCTKDDRNGLHWNTHKWVCVNNNTDVLKEICFNGKVVARFWCDKVEKIRSYLEPEQWYMTSDLGGSGLLGKSCLSFKELDDYLLSGNGYAIHINKLEIFDKPKEISEFKKANTLSLEQLREFGLPYTEEMYKDMATKGKWFLTRAPQSFCFVEI